MIDPETEQLQWQVKAADHLAAAVFEAKVLSFHPAAYKISFCY